MKRNKILAIIFLFSLFINAHGQGINKFYAQINSANTLAKIGQTNKAISTYESAFEKVEYVNVRYLKKVLKLSKISKEKEKESYYKIKIEQQLNGTNGELIRIVDSLFSEDQKLRNRKYFNASKYYRECLEDPTCNKKSKKYQESEKLANIFFKKDSSNVHYLLNLFEQYGYIGEKLIGKDFDNVVVILLHFDKDENNEILYPILEQALAEGKISPLHFAQIQDRHMHSSTGLQKYWTWPCTNKFEKLSFSESDIPQILARRESIGLYGSSVSQKKKRRWWVLQNKFNR